MWKAPGCMCHTREQLPGSPGLPGASRCHNAQPCHLPAVFGHITIWDSNPWSWRSKGFNGPFCQQCWAVVQAHVSLCMADADAAGTFYLFGFFNPLYKQWEVSACMQNHLGRIGRVERREFFLPCSVLCDSCATRNLPKLVLELPNSLWP